MSFMKTRNRRGPRIEPCGTPAFRKVHSVETPGKTTRCFFYLYNNEKAILTGNLPYPLVYFINKSSMPKSIKDLTYRIRSNYRTYPYKRTVKKFRSLQITASVLFSLLLYKGICCGYSFKLHRLVDAIQMSSHNICFYKDNQKKVALSSLNKSYSDFL